MTVGIAIFVKTPGRSPLKTRLHSPAMGLNPDLINAWYLRAAYAVAAVAKSAISDVPAAGVYWAVAEHLAMDDAVWNNLPRISQGEGELGERMHRVHSELVLRHGVGILLGADTPHLDPTAVAAALAWLDISPMRQVLGPAVDGGFWLYGANQVVALKHWTRVSYSQADTAVQFRRALSGYGECLLLQPVTDVDYPDDLLTCAGALQRLSAPLPEQRALLHWMQACWPLWEGAAASLESDNAVEPKESNHAD